MALVIKPLLEVPTYHIGLPGPNSDCSVLLNVFTYLFVCLFKRKSERKRDANRDLPSAESFSKWSQQTGQSLSEARSQELPLGVSPT